MLTKVFDTSITTVPKNIGIVLFNINVISVPNTAVDRPLQKFLLKTMLEYIFFYYSRHKQCLEYQIPLRS